MKKFSHILLVLFSVFPAFAYAAGISKKGETIAIVCFFVIAFIGILIYWVIWKNRKHEKSADKYKVKTFEVMKNGRKVIMTKKYRVISPDEFPEEVKRSKS